MGEAPVSAATGPLEAQRGWQFAVASGILGWILDAYYFFILVFLVDVLAVNFRVSKAAIVWSITVTLATRPLGAVILGSLGDRYGRRRPLIACVLFFSLVSALTPFAPNYLAFLILRALYGIGMGGYWGIGASLVIESSPARWRGLFSGVLQAGYPLGYLMAALAIPLIDAHFNWNWLFLDGLFIAALIAVLTWIAPESHAWEKLGPVNASEMLRSLRRNPPKAARLAVLFVYLVVLMTVVTCLSHGTQDLYPDFLKTIHKFSSALVSKLAVFYNVGAVIGSLIIGHLSEKIGRRYSILIALVLCLVSMPQWAFGASLFALAAGAFLMQFGVQGVFGVIPAHLNELSPPSVRSLFPGVVYQLGVLLSAPAVGVEYVLRNRIGYAWALTAFELCVIAAIFLLCLFGPERRGRDLAS